MDTPLLLLAADAWRRGDNPYDLHAAVADTRADQATIFNTLSRGPQAFVYSPPVYAVLAPLTVLPWAVQRATWNGLNTAMLIGALFLICRLYGFPVTSMQSVALISIGLASNPSAICIALGQTGIATLFLLCLSWRFAPPDQRAEHWARAALAGSIAGLAAVLKPQIVILYMLLDLRGPRWRIAVCTVGFAVAYFAAAVLMHGDIGATIVGWLSNMRALTHADADPLHGSLPHQLINLQSPLAVLTGSRSRGTALALLACALLAAWYVMSEWSARLAPRRPLDARYALSAMSILMLLIFYHRLYDAVFLMIPAGLAIRLIATAEVRGWLLLAALTPLWVPLASIFYHALSLTGPFSANPLTQAFIIQNQTWCLVMAFLLVCDVRRRAAMPVPAPAIAIQTD